MELREMLPYIISIMTLSIVLVQFFVKRNDEKKTFILNKRYEVYQNFKANLSRHDLELAKLHDRLNDILGGKTWDAFFSSNCNTVNEVKELLLRFYKPILGFSIPAFEFNIISNKALNQKISHFYNIFAIRNREILKIIHEAKTREDCLHAFNFLNDKYEKSKEFEKRVYDTYQEINVLMKKDLGIKE